MMLWLSLNTCISLLCLAAAALLRSAPARLRLTPLLAALIAWCLPVHMMRYEASAAPFEPILSVAASTAATVPASVPTPTTNWLLWAMVVVTIVGIIRFAWDVAANHHHRINMLHESYPAPHLVRLLPKSLQHRVPHIRVWPGHAGAAVSGWIQPSIWVGECHLDTPELEGILCHEAVHASRRDNFLLMGVTLVERLLWWNPLVRLVAAQARLDLERACDEACVHHLPPKRYRANLAALLLANHGLLPGSRLTSGLGGSARANMLRIQSLERRTTMKFRHVLTLCLMVLTLPTLFAAGQQIEEDTNPVLKIKDVDTPPIFTKKVSPKYPQAAVKDRVQSYVILEAVLHTDGTIDKVKVVREKHEGYGMGEKAAGALKQWEFLPANKDGKPVDVTMHFKIDFILHDSKQTAEEGQ